MLESIRHWKDFTDSGIPSQFLLFSLYTWIIMLPRSIFAGIYYYNQPGFTVKPIKKYLSAALASTTIAAIAIISNRLTSQSFNWIENIALSMSILLLVLFYN